MIPTTENALVIRTDFSDDAAWQEICQAIKEPVGAFQAQVNFLDDREYDALSPGGLLLLLPENFEHSFACLVDDTTISQADRPILCIDLFDEPGRTFRVIPSQMWAVENNLSIANMDFSEFADNVDPDGVFRGFPETQTG